MSVAVCDFRHALDRAPEFRKTWNFYLARQLQWSRQLVELMSQRTVEARLDIWLGMNGGLMPGKGQWADVADEIGTSPEALYRELAKHSADKP